MNDEFFYKLLYDFPHLFPEGEESQIFVPEGWLTLVYDLCKAITEHQFERNYYPLTVLQIKEKFGHLRFYIQGSSDETIEQLIMDAEDRSGTLCEISGEPGSLYERDGWLRILSDVEAEKLRYRKVQTTVQR